MRKILILLALASVSACERNSGAAQSPEAAAVKAEVTFEGAKTPGKAAILAHGERLSHVLGCRGCHTPTLEGQLFNDDAPELGKLYASNLTRAIPEYSDAQLEALLRDGRHPVRGDMWVMPSEVIQRLSDADMKALIGHLRSLKPSGETTPPPALSAIAKAEVAKGKMKPTSAYMAEYRNKHPVELGDHLALGRYVAGVSCAECHGADLSGVPDFGPGINVPDLDIVGTYSDAELEKLLTTGEGKVRKDLGLMSLVGKNNFSYLTAREREAVIAYLKARAERPR